MSVSGMCTDVVTIRRAVDSVDTAGSVVKTYADHITGQRAKVDSNVSREGSEFGRRSNRETRSVYMPGVVDVIEDDTIVFGLLTFEVRGVGVGPRDAYTKADVELIR